jgi:hypothetical protein
VLDAVAFKDARGAIVHAHWEVHGQLSARLAQHGDNPWIKIQPLGGEIKLLLGNRPRALLAHP